MKFKVGDRVVINNNGRADHLWIGTIIEIEENRIYCEDWTEPNGKIHNYRLYSDSRKCELEISQKNANKLKKVLGID